MSTNTIRVTLGVILGLGFYIPLFWRTAMGNRGNKLVESGCLAAGFFMLLGLANTIPKFPIWLAVCFGTLAFAFCLATLFFVLQRAYNALRRRKNHPV
jgi:hypothetical protein